MHERRLFMSYDVMVSMDEDLKNSMEEVCSDIGLSIIGCAMIICKF